MYIVSVSKKNSWSVRVHPLQSTFLNSVTAGVKSTTENSIETEGEDSFEDVLLAAERELEADGSDRLDEDPDEVLVHAADIARDAETKLEKPSTATENTLQDSGEVRGNKVLLEDTTKEVPKVVVTVRGSEKPEEQVIPFSPKNLKNSIQQSAPEEHTVVETTDADAGSASLGFEKKIVSSSVRTPLEQMMVLPPGRQPSDMAAESVTDTATEIIKKGEAEIGVKASLFDTANVQRLEYDLLKSGRGSATLVVNKSDIAAEEAQLDAIDFDVRITKPNQPEIITPKVLSHPVQSILHAQMPENLRNANPKIAQIADVLEVGLASIDTPAETKSSPSPILPATPRPDHQVAVAKQLIEAVKSAQAADKVIEVALNPAELGKVRMMLTPVEAGISVNILADRSDTLDLLRRHIGDLEQSFMDMGYDDINFSFGQNPSEQSDSGSIFDDDPESVTAQVAQSNIANSASENTLAYASNGIDIRV
ncbi:MULTISPECIES: flagellar hook-length control protein FliK [Rhodobacterales]|uniref:flagellar hook-length control protein FliK n=1 Tax=Ascidiaceihabitans sp. TaxID=1872644 RepID=UPI0032979D20